MILIGHEIPIYQNIDALTHCLKNRYHKIPNVVKKKDAKSGLET